MTTQVKTMTPIEYVEAAEREYAAGNDRESARLLADATDALFDMLAEARGFDPSDHLAMAIAMGKQEGRRFYYSDRFGAGRNLRLHAETGLMEEYGMVEWLHEAQFTFIHKTLEELDAGSGSAGS